MNEQVLQNKIIKQKESEGYFVIKLHVTNKNGIPDLLCLKEKEKPIFIEVKKPKSGRLSQIQRYRIKELQSKGFIAYATSSTKRFHCTKEIQCALQCEKCDTFVDDLYDI